MKFKTTTFLFPSLLIILSQLISDITSHLNSLQSDEGPFQLNWTPKQSRRRPRQRMGFSFFREFIAPLPGVLHDILPTETEDDPIVETRNGLLQGTVKLSRDGRKYAAFLGVPYAEPPVRFEPPQKLTKRWRGIRNAARYSSACFHQDVFVTGRIKGKEDCLYANIYTPKLNSKLPVMVYIHGGGFFSGSGDFYQGKYFMDEDVILVIMNYRLAALGFLNTEDENVRGNMGLKDQNMMLQWVRENIRGFGGDPGQVTIFGESAGSASVGYHILSPLSKGLFQKAIALSGTPLSPWALSKHPAKSARNLAKTAGCPTKDTKSMIECLKSVPLEDIAKGYRGMMNTINSPADFFVPSIETTITDDTMISEHPEDILKRGVFNNVPLINGVCSMEGLLYSSRIMVDKYVKKNFGKNWNDWIPTLLAYDVQNITMSNKLKSDYFPSLNGNLNLSKKENFLNLTNLLSDGLFFHPSYRFLKEYRKHAPVHLYYLTYQGRISVYDVFSKVPILTDQNNGIPAEVVLGTGIFSDLLRYRLTNKRPSELGASHGDSVMLLFNIRRAPGIGRLSMDYEMSKAFIKSLVDFASSREPLSFDEVQWPDTNDCSNSSMKYMQLDIPGRLVNEPFNDRMKMWDSVQ